MIENADRLRKEARQKDYDETNVPPKTGWF